MLHHELPDGMYLIVGRAPKKLVDHYGVLDIGNRTGVQGKDDSGPVVIHLTSDVGLLWQPRDSILRDWNVLAGPVVDEAPAIARMNEAAANPAYNLTENNCEQFARYVITGKHESKQLQAVGWVAAGAIAAAIFFGNNGDEDGRNA
jgi:hypothetical protein